MAWTPAKNPLEGICKCTVCLLGFDAHSHDARQNKLIKEQPENVKAIKVNVHRNRIRGIMQHIPDDHGRHSQVAFSPNAGSFKTI